MYCGKYMMGILWRHVCPSGQMINSIPVSIFCLSLVVSLVKGSYGACDEMFLPLVFFNICLLRCLNSLLVLDVSFSLCFWPKIREKKGRKNRCKEPERGEIKRYKGAIETDLTESLSEQGQRSFPQRQKAGKTHLASTLTATKASSSVC